MVIRLRKSKVRDPGRPLATASRRVGELVQHGLLAVLDGDEVLFVERLPAPGTVIDYTRIAGRLPLHASSSGSALLAHDLVLPTARSAGTRCAVTAGTPTPTASG